MGWLWMALIGLVTLGLLWLFPAARRIAPFLGGAILFGAAGYGLQQNSGLAGTPVQADAKRIEVDPTLLAFRQVIMPADGQDQATLAASDAKVATGDTTGAAQELTKAIAQRPGSAPLWAGLGSVLTAHDSGQVSPAALFAFREAFRLAPSDAGPPFFLGLAYLQSGDMQATKRAWLQTLALAPRDAPYRVEIAERLVMIDQFTAMQAATR